jgi:methyl-accepting chemotaxis protein
MSAQGETPHGHPRTLLASYGVVIGAVVFAVAVAIVMNRFHDRLERALDLVELQYEEALQYATLMRHVQDYAWESAEVLSGAGDVAARAEYAQAARRVLGEISKHGARRRLDEDEDEVVADAREAAAVAEAFEAFVRRMDELARMDRTAPDFRTLFRAAYYDLLRQRVMRGIEHAVDGEHKDAERNVREYRVDTTRWTWGVAILLIFIGALSVPVYARINGNVRRLVAGARRIAAGDYMARVVVRGMFRPIGDTFNAMAHRVHEHQLAQLKMAKELQASSAELLAVAKQTETNAADESAAVEETRRTMTALLASATEIAESADKVASSAEQSTRASEGIGEQIIKLSAQSQKIRKITAIIQGIADKSDVLALNASLEGAKAGEGGRGFVLLGSEMRRLAESVSSAANEVGDLASEIEELSKRAVISTEVGQKLAAETLDVARRINLITSQQRGATEQVTRSMEDVHQYTQHSLSAAQQTRATASDLVRTSDELEQLVQASSGRSAERA